MTISPEIMASIEHLPPLSQSALRLVQFTGGNNTLEEIVSIVETDPILTARALRAAGSAALGLRSAPQTAAQAVTALGSRAVTAIALKIGAAKVYDDPLEGYLAQNGALWNHTLRVAVAARFLSSFAVGGMDAGLAFTGGVLHDIGKALMSVPLKGKTAIAVSALTQGNRADFDAAERGLIGADHAEVGAMLGLKWGLPENLQSVIAFHHRPSQAPSQHQGLVYCIHLADHLSMLHGIDTGADGMRYQLDPAYRTFLRMTPGELERTAVQVDDEYRRMLAALGQEENPS